jgi:hypothetical protein
MEHAVIRSVFVFLLSAIWLFGQASPQTPKPSPELEKQSFFVGTWKLEGTIMRHDHSKDNLERANGVSCIESGRF